MVKKDDSCIPAGDNITLLLLPRFIAFLFLFGGSIFLLKSRAVIFELLVFYGAAALAYLSLLLLRNEYFVKYLKRVLITHLLLEIIISGIMVYHSGGNKSPLVMLFILSIASAAMIYQIHGALFASIASSLSYLTAIYFYLERLRTGDGHVSILSLADKYPEILFSVSINIVLFTAVGFIAGFIAERLKDRGVLLKTAHEELKSAQMMTSDILEGMSSGLICIDCSREILMVNRTAREMLRLEIDGVYEGTIDDVLKGGLRPLYRFLMNALSAESTFDQYELVVATADGRKIPLGISTSLLSCPDGKPHGIIAVFNDLTESKNLQRRLRVYDRLAAVGQLSAGIAHEIRNPLTSISGSVEVLRSELELHGSNRKLMDVILKESQRLNRILTEFLRFARIKPTFMTEVSYKKIVEDVIEFISNDRRLQSGIALTNAVTEDITAFGDEEKIRQILINLIFNAIESLPEREGRVFVSEYVSFESDRYMATGDFDKPVKAIDNPSTMKIFDPDKYSGLSVVDNGSGIPDDRIEKVFHPFYSTRQGGTGLGLSIVQRLVESMDGKLLFETVPEKGSIFSIFLKKSPPEQYSTPARGDAEPIAVPALPTV